MAKSKPAEELNKTQMVTAALATLGADTPPQQILDHIRDTYGVELSKSMVSSYKSNILKKQRGGTGRKGDRVAADGTVELKDLRALRDIIDRVGMNEVKHLIQVLDR